MGKRPSRRSKEPRRKRWGIVSMFRKRSGRRASIQTAETTARRDRFELIDLLRGTAIALMFAYHFSFDLNYFGILHQIFYQDPFWLAARSVILSSFLVLVGASLMLAAGDGIRWPSFCVDSGSWPRVRPP